MDYEKLYNLINNEAITESEGFNAIMELWDAGKLNNEQYMELITMNSLPF